MKKEPLGFCVSLKPILAFLLLPLLFSQAFAGTWVQLTNNAPGGILQMLLLTDGTVMGQSGGNSWFRLTPDDQGSYVNGSWSTNSPMQFSRTWYSSAVLLDGRVFVAGAEYGSGTTNAEVYDPLDDAWTYIPVPPGLITTNNNPPPATLQNNAGFVDSGSVLLANGAVLITPVVPASPGGTVIFDPVSNTLSAGPALTNGDPCVCEASWVRLRDDSILMNNYSQQSQRYISSLNRWIPDANIPVQIMSLFGNEFGAALLLPDGRAFFIGGSSNTALYTPSGNTSPGTWTAGPPIPNGQGVPDGPAAMMANGKILCAVSPAPFGPTNVFTSPVSFYEYDYSVGSIGAFTATNIPGPPLLPSTWPTFSTVMLDLPDGNVLFSFGQPQLYVYQPDPPVLAAGKPTLGSISVSASGTYKLTGSLLTGLSAGAAYGDDAQMDSNYPLLRMTNATGKVSYGRTFNWSSSTAQFTLPQRVLTNGPVSYSTVAVANGIASEPISFRGPLWVDFNYAGSIQNGTFSSPYKTLTNGISAVPTNGTIFCKGPASHRETPRITKPVSIVAYGGTVTIGR